MKVIHRIFVGAVAACLSTIAPTTHAQTANTNHIPKSERANLSFRDSTYLRRAAEANLMSQKLGQLAADKGTSSQVKELGQKLAQTGQKAYQDLKTIAQQKGVTLPTELNQRSTHALNQLSSRSGAEFDKMFLRDVVRTHEAGVRSTEAEANKGVDSQLKQFASGALPALQDELKQARTLYASVRPSTKEPAGAATK